MIRAAISVCDAGQRAARAHAKAGITELELWAAVRGEMERAAGTRLPVLADLVSGLRTTEIGGPPSSRIIEDGDLVLCDLVPRVEGYWGDSCATSPSASPARKHVRPMHAPARCSLSSSRRSAPARSPAIWTPGRGHSSSSPTTPATGSAPGYHEEPRLVPGSTTVLEAGMVVAIEPGTYADAGVRVEQVVLVTPDGCEVLSGHDLGL